MHDALVEYAAVLAVGVGIAALLVVAIPARGAWRSWRRARITQQAASALLDAHATRLDDTLRAFDERTGALADDGEQLAEALAELRADASRLRWMLGSVGEERDRLGRELYELVLPTVRAAAARTADSPGAGEDA